MRTGLLAILRSALFGHGIKLRYYEEVAATQVAVGHCLGLASRFALDALRLCPLRRVTVRAVRA